MQNPLISIIVPIYNAECYLQKCIDSLLNQTYSNIEIILVDDGSTDNSARICDVLSQKDLRIKIVHQENQGVSATRNKGLDIATGSYIGFVDADDTVQPDFYKNLYSALIEYDADLSICNQSLVMDNQTFVDGVSKEVLCFNKNNAIEQMLLGKIFRGGPCNKLFKADLCKNLKFDIDINVGEDLLFCIKYLLKCEKIIFVPQSYYNYFIHEGSAWTSNFTEKTFTDHTSRERIFEILKNTGDKHLIELGHTAFLLCDIGLIGKLYYEKNAKKIYCEILQKSIRKHFAFSRIKNVSLFQKIGIISAYIDIKLFFLLFLIKEKLKS